MMSIRVLFVLRMWQLNCHNERIKAETGAVVFRCHNDA